MPSVLTVPGATQLRRMPNSAHSKASVFIMPSTPPRAAAVCTNPLRPERMQAVTNTIDPPFASMK